MQTLKKSTIGGKKQEYVENIISDRKKPSKIKVLNSISKIGQKNFK